MLWRSEFRNTLRQYLLKELLTLSQARWYADKAESMMRRHEYVVQSDDVLKLVAQTGHSSHNCEYIALARAEGLQLVTGDQRIVSIFPDAAILLEEFIR